MRLQCKIKRKIINYLSNMLLLYYQVVILYVLVILNSLTRYNFKIKKNIFRAFSKHFNDFFGGRLSILVGKMEHCLEPGVMGSCWSIVVGKQKLSLPTWTHL